ncbi:hypothetical protein C5O00_05845 [Pukyongia salina]|uniref:Peptidase M61 catalytic domain-containing protein n=1 Tax=Pukyongia salina TaxID=2094025 RepID=A0A2S0HVN0_9FLAO|nr:hypothetical protein [Pukyongia salina]AVI50719.1 hypothetical protein C5O00_05845 [Pukyongia salina]
MKVLNILRILILIAILQIVLTGFMHGDDKFSDVDNISYVISLSTENSKVAKIKVSFIPQDSILHMADGANHLTNRWASFVHNLKVTTSRGKTIEVDALPDARWRMRSLPTETIIVSYEVHLDHEAHSWSGGIDGVAYATELGVFYTGRTLLILNGQNRSSINVDFKLPMNWSVTTPWDKINQNTYAYKVNSIFDLVNATIFAGTHKEATIRRSDFELVFAFGTKDIISREMEFENLAEGVMDYYISLMGGIPKSSPTDSLNKVMVVISSSSSTDGEAIGNNISILIEKDGDKFSETIWRFIFAHEFFHLWNGKSFSPKAEDTEWFKEGFTNYYTLKALHHTGFLNDTSYINLLSSFFYERYISDPGVGELSMTDGALKHDHWGLIYSGGMFVAIAQDILIRLATNNNSNIDDLLRSLFFKYNGDTNGYSLEDLFSEMSGLNEVDQIEFYNTYIIGHEIIPIDKYLSMVGFDSKVENGTLFISKKDNVSPEQQAIIKGILGQIISEK